MTKKDQTHSVPQIIVPPRFLSIVREVLDDSKSGSSDAEHLSIIHITDQFTSFRIVPLL